MDDVGNQGPGNRGNNNGPFLSVREAIDLFVSRREYATFVQNIQQKLDSIVSRPELDLRWKSEDARYELLVDSMKATNAEVTAALSSITQSIAEMKDARWRWVQPTLTVLVAPLLTGLVILLVQYWLTKPH